MSARTRHAQGFTLVEILIVVVILGILAAIVIPQFTRASESAQASSLASQLQTVRSQIELYQVQHGGQYPDLSSNWGDMTSETDDGYGPYFQQAPRNPLAPSGVDRDSIGSGDDVAWVWDGDANTIKANVRPGVETELERAGMEEGQDFEVVGGGTT